MAISKGPNLGLAVNGAQGDPHYAELMQMWRGLDCLVQCVILDKDLAAPPANPADGAVYIVAATPTGAWAGQARAIARWSAAATAWEFFAPKKGWSGWVQDEDVRYRYTGTAWAVEAAGGGGSSGGAVIQSAVAASVTATTAETTLATISLPALGPNDAVRVTLLLSWPTSSNAKVVRAKLAGSQVLILSSTTTTSANYQFVIRNRGAANSQITQASNKANFGDTTAAITLTTVDTSTSKDLTITLAMASAAETGVLEAYTVEVLKG